MVGEVIRFNFRGGKVMELSDWLVVSLMFSSAAALIGTLVYLFQLMGH